MLAKCDRKRPCRCGSGLAALFTVQGWPACPRCVEWTLLHSSPRAWAEFNAPLATIPKRKSVPRVRKLVTHG